MEQVISGFIGARRSAGLFRRLTEVSLPGGARVESGGREYVNFSSNDYLGLSSHPEVLNAAREALRSVMGASASRLITGSTVFHHELEELTAEFKGKPAAMVLNSGYQANVGIISALCGRGDCVFYDRLSHASMIDGIKLSGAAPFRFRHNDPGHLEELIRKNRNRFRTALIVTESVFSMDGDIAPLEEITRLKENYDCVFMVDEAHATGIFGPGGSGMAEETGLTRRIDIIMGTFSKALGAYGAYAAMDGDLRDFLINQCRSFIYSTALPPSIMAACTASIAAVKNEPERRKALLERSGRFREGLRGRGMRVRGGSQIVPVILGDSGRAVKVSGVLREKGWWVAPFRPPTVPEGESRLRVSLSYGHDTNTLDRFAEDLEQALFAGDMDR